MIKKLDDYKMKLMKNRKEFIFSLEYFFFKGAALTEREEAIWFNFKIFWQKEILV